MEKGSGYALWMMRFSVFVLVLCWCRTTTGSSNISSSSSSSVGRNDGGYFAICLAIKDDEDVLEWVEYHRRIGCSKFYIFDNNSKEPLNTTLSEYIASGLVQYTYLEGTYKPSVQNYIYDQCVKRFNKLHTWMGFIDVDEFLVPERPGTSVPDILQRYEQYGGLAVNWLRFGSSGYDQRPTQGGVLGSYSTCSMGSHIKTIANLVHTTGPQTNTHSFMYKTNTNAPNASVSGRSNSNSNSNDNHNSQSHSQSQSISNDNNVNAPSSYAVNVHGHRVRQWLSDPPTAEVLVLRHYMIKSLTDFGRKIARGGGGGGRKDWAFFYSREKMMTETCPVISMADVPVLGTSPSPARR